MPTQRRTRTGRQASVGGVVDRHGAAYPVRQDERWGEHRLVDDGGRGPGAWG